MPLQDDDLKTARDVRVPKDLPWHEAAELADAADTAGWCIGWLVSEVERLRKYDQELDLKTKNAES